MNPTTIALYEFIICSISSYTEAPVVLKANNG